MKIWIIVMIDNATGEIYSEEIECYGFPAITEPYCGISGRQGTILRVNRVLKPNENNRYR